jgi:hypothetical protein
MRKALITLWLAAVTTVPAWAHEGETHDDHPHAAPHGGVVRTVSQFHFELVTSGDQLKVYLLDDRLRLLPTKGRKGEAIVQMGGKTQRVPLQPAGDAFVGTMNLSKASKYVAVVSLDVDGKTLRGRFSHPSHSH